MADIQHKNITDPQIHEPKGISAATAGTYYIADGEGSGEWARDAAQGVDSLFQLKVVWNYPKRCPYSSGLYSEAATTCTFTTLSGTPDGVSAQNGTLKIPPGVYSLASPFGWETSDYIPQVFRITAGDVTSDFVEGLTQSPNRSYSGGSMVYSAGNITLSAVGDWNKLSDTSGFQPMCCEGYYGVILTRIKSFD